MEVTKFIIYNVIIYEDIQYAIEPVKYDGNKII